MRTIRRGDDLREDRIVAEEIELEPMGEVWNVAKGFDRAVRCRALAEGDTRLGSGAGEHIWLEVEKNGANTGFVAQRLAEAAGVKEWDVGYAGLKDRYAITRQWFSIYLPKGEAPLQQALEELRPLCEHLAVFGAYPITQLEAA